MNFTKEFLERVLENHFQGIDISNYAVSDLLPSGENYASEMKRIVVTYTLETSKGNNTVSVVAKSIPDDECTKQAVLEMKMFDCEIHVYEAVLPKLSTFDYREKMAPLMYYASMKPVPVILLEDLSQLGYKVAQRNIGLNLDQCLLVVEKLAYFHAATATLHEQDSSILPKHEMSVYRKTETTTKILNVGYEEAIKVCQSRAELHGYTDKLRKGKELILEKVYNVHKTKSNFKVLNHGDFWLNNVMFYKNSDVAFVDFQVSCFASPCLDLHYFLATSIKYDTKNYKNHIVDHYFATLTNYLEKLHAITFPKREEFDEEFRLMSYCGFGASIIVLAVIKATETEGASIGNFIADEGKHNFRHRCFHNEEYVKEMIHYLPYYESMGIFDE